MAQRSLVTAPELLLKIVLTGTQTHYECPGLIDDKRLEHLLHSGKQILYKSHQESDVRQNLGFSPQVWEGLTAVLNRAIPVLEVQSFAWKNEPGSDYDGSSSDLIAANYLPLVKDIERLNDICTIARNLLATTRKAQNLAAEKAFDQQVLKLIDVCVRVTARGFDGESNARNQDKWQKVVNLYKRLLITCLQFLHNFIMHNEHRKLVLWLDLFGNTSIAAQQAQQREIMAVQEQLDREHKRRDYYKAKAGLANTEMQAESHGQEGEEAEEIAKALTLNAKPETIRSLQTVSVKDLTYDIEDVHALFDLVNAEDQLSPEEEDKKTALMHKIKMDLARLSGLTGDQLDSDPELLLRAGVALREHLLIRETRLANNNVETTSASSAATEKKPQNDSLPNLATYANFAAIDQPITEEDLVMPRTSASAAETLQEAKDELMSRLQDNQQIMSADEDGPDDLSQGEEISPDHEIAPSIEESLGEEDELDEDGEEEEEDYRRLGDQERGLLTDVPLVLGPTEIEALPMIIQAGIVDNFGMRNATVDRQGTRNMQAVRCHILLAQEAGRNVLRELLIFIAAWDLPDDEFYFRMMVQIMEAILKNGLMSHAYSDFGQAKDIISPAQAVVIKILTNIFRTRYSPSQKGRNSRTQERPQKPRTPSPLTRVDVLTVRYIFTVFRGNIIPETCALIYLQGQIRSNLAIAEDFPLNLWDMERVYEGVYQFLEFFAVLTENNDWKQLLIEWEIVYDLVTLIKELDASIPKASLVSGPVHGKAPPRDRTGLRGHASNAYAAQFVQTTTTTETITDPNTTGTQSSTHTQAEQDPSDFEWRNLKKLIVLVLSSLVWKSPIVQDQIRTNGGVPTILSCTQNDGHNPYIREHAIMCLRFLLEGNKDNQAIISELEAQGIANTAELEKEFNVRASVRDGKVQIDGQKSIDQLAERFQALDTNAFRQRQRVPHTVAMPAAKSVRSAYTQPEVGEVVEVRDGVEYTQDYDDLHTKRVMDVGDML